MLPHTAPSPHQAATSCWHESKLCTGSQQHHLPSAIGIYQDFEVVGVLKMRKHKEVPWETTKHIPGTLSDNVKELSVAS